MEIVVLIFLNLVSKSNLSLKRKTEWTNLLSLLVWDASCAT